nr:uncharacterized protein LOC109618208 [Crassostrea gigas]XP_034316781.1 uncharacterized protein LOC117686192 [Crassostrea gigas]XP_034319721.1 uncharacterized protein LOC117687389 isoform X1 [Crassostrea gigas]
MMELVEIQTAKETSFNKKRGTNWTPEEEILLIEEVLKYEETLFGKMKGSGSKGKHGQVKESTWRSIAETLNLNYKNDRDNETIKKKFNNIKQRGKEKISMLRRPKTGGGPAPPSLTASEDALMQAFDGRPQICGLADGIDTDANDETTETSKDVESITLAPGTTSSTSSTSKPSASTSSSLSERPTASKKSKRKQMKDVLEEEELENLRMDNKRIKVEIEKLIIEKQKLEAEKELIEIKKAFMVRQFEERYPHSIVYTNTSNTCVSNEL